MCEVLNIPRSTYYQTLTKTVTNRGTTTTLNEKWVADIMYIHTVKDGWCYLASVLDLHTKKIVGYSFSRSMTTELVLHALHNAVMTQKPNSGLILHMDLGTQYTSEAFTCAVQDYE